MNKEVIAGTLLFMLTTALIAMIIHVSHTANVVHHSTPMSASPPYSFFDSLIQSDDQNTINNNNNDSSSTPSLKPRALFVVGDSTVDCGGNSLFYPFLRHHNSLLPCFNGSSSTLIPYFLGISLSLLS